MLLEPTLGGGVSPQVSEIVVPVISVDQLLATPTNRSSNVDLSGSAGGNVTVFTCPKGEEWHLVEYIHEVLAAVTKLKLKVGGVQSNLTPTHTAFTNLNMRDYIMREGDELIAEATGNAGDNSEFFSVSYGLVELT